MPITTAVQGFAGAGSFRADDRRLMASAKGQETIARLWRDSRVDFQIVYLNRDLSPEAAMAEIAQRHGPATPADLKREFGAQIARRPGAITVVFTHNEGNARMPLTGWIIAHRAYHIFEESYRNGQVAHSWPPRHRHPRLVKPYRATYAFVASAIDRFQKAYRLADEHGRPTTYRAFPQGGVAHCIGTSRAARERNLADSGELKHEAFAQYVLTGTVRFNAPPERYDAHGRTFLLDPDHRDELTAFVRSGEAIMTQSFDALIAYATGKIFVL